VDDIANSYASATFVIDTDCAIATPTIGLTALKGSPCAATDDICVKMDSSGKPAVLTLESDITCKSLNIGYGAKDGGTTSCGQLVNSDNVVVTLAASGKVYLRANSKWTCNGTLRSLGTGNGNADQTVTALHANNQDVQINGEWWTLVADLTGKRLDCTATTTTTYITCTTDPVTTGLYVGAAIEVRTRADGTLKCSKTISALTTTRVSWASGNVSCDAGDSVYLVIAATDKVYSMSGTTMTFGDGAASAWNNNGGAVIPNNATITQPGITLTCADLTEANKATMSNTLPMGTVAWTGVAMQGFKYSNGTFYRCLAPSFTDCSFRSVTTAITFYAYSCRNLYMSGCIATSNSGYGLVAANYAPDATLINCVGISMSGYGLALQSYCSNSTLTNCTGRSVASYGLYVTASDDVLLTNCTGLSGSGRGAMFSACHHLVATGLTATSTNSFGYQLASAGDSQTFTNCTFITSHATNAAFYIENVSRNLRLLGCRLSGTVPLGVFSTYGGGAIQAFRSAATGDAGLLKWFASDIDLAGSYPLGTSLGLPTKDLWVETPACWVPGLSAYGATTITTTLNGGTVATQYRVSHDYGLTWTAYAAVDATITDSPNQDGEYIQFRVSKTDSGATVPVHSGISVVVTFVNGWTMPALSPSIITAAPVIGSRVVRGVNAL